MKQQTKLTAMDPNPTSLKKRNNFKSWINWFHTWSIIRLILGVLGLCVWSNTFWRENTKTEMLTELQVLPWDQHLPGKTWSCWQAPKKRSVQSQILGSRVSFSNLHDVLAVHSVWHEGNRSCVTVFICSGANTEERMSKARNIVKLLQGKNKTHQLFVNNLGGSTMTS